MRRRRKAKTVIGWREWIELPGLCDIPIKAKIDTGARTSALHAFDLTITGTGDAVRASFELHPVQRSSAGAVRVDCPVLGFRRVRSSNGRIETRPLIVTAARAAGVEWPIEMTLASRDEMGFRILLGRAALRRRFHVDPGRSFLGDRLSRKRRKLKETP